jgi:beta-glucanase (GH16 family)
MRRRIAVAVLALAAPLIVVHPPAVQAAASKDACGVRPVKSGGTLWSCSFVDDFSRGLDRTKWLPQTIFASGQDAATACYVDNPADVSVSSGALHLTVRKESSPLACPALGPTATTNYSAGMVTTYHLFSQQYGRFEARVKNTATTYPGLHEAFWLWPDDRYGSTAPWPASGEIDVAETYSGDPGNAVPFLHYVNLASGTDGTTPQPGVNTAYCAAQRGVYNTYTVEWTDRSIVVWVNGRLCLANYSGNDAFKKRYIIALTQGLGVGPNAYDGRAPLPATMDVDYVKVWK